MLVVIIIIAIIMIITLSMTLPASAFNSLEGDKKYNSLQTFFIVSAFWKTLNIYTFSPKFALRGQEKFRQIC